MYIHADLKKKAKQIFAFFAFNIYTQLGIFERLRYMYGYVWVCVTVRKYLITSTRTSKIKKNAVEINYV